MKLIICEKPSVGAAIAAALGVKNRKDGYLEGKGLIISWCIGHLVSLADAGAYDMRFKKWKYEYLPILPEPFQFVLSPGKEEQFSILKNLMERPDVSELINACDAGREGELIFRLVVEMAGCMKPFSRLWISSMEDNAIRTGFEELKPGREYDALYHSALCRQQADWLIGINATRLFSVLYHSTLSVGRVQTPTLSMLAERDSKIRLFQKEKYYLVHIQCGEAEAISEKISSLPEAETIRDNCNENDAVCTHLTTEQKTVNPPKLFDLTTLQREANRFYGYTAKQTLDYAQNLYEKKLITYPRTDSRHLTSDMADTVTAILPFAKALSPFEKCGDFTPNIAVLLSDQDVSDHHAIIPTMELAKTDIKTLPLGEKNILMLIGCKLLCALADSHTYETITAQVSCGGKNFTTKGKQIITKGWKEIEESFRSSLKDNPEDSEDGEIALPELKENQTFESVSSFIREHFTAPPKPYTEDTLLSAMEHAGVADMPEDAERKGLGTPATRASIIEKLVSSGFIERIGKNLIPTKAGINLVTILPDTLTSPQLTAQWEQQLSLIAKGQADHIQFMAEIKVMAAELVKTYSHISEDGVKLFAPQKESLGICPRCGEAVFEGKKNFYCGNRNCAFVLWKNDRFWTSRRKELTKKMASDLLKKGRVKVKGMYSEKKDSVYDATVILDDTGSKYINFKLEFEKRKEKPDGR